MMPYLCNTLNSPPDLRQGVYFCSLIHVQHFFTQLPLFPNSLFSDPKWRRVVYVIFQYFFGDGEDESVP